MQIDKTLYQEINEYCHLNNIKTKDFIHKILKEAFLKEKYGTQPFFMNNVISDDINIKSTHIIENTSLSTLTKDIETNQNENKNIELEQSNNSDSIKNNDIKENIITPKKKTRKLN